MHNKFRLLLIICSLLILCACTKTGLTPSQDAEQNPAEAERVWQSYLQSARQSINPFRTQMSLRYGTEGDTRRVTALLWGNTAQEIRLDVNAGVGVNIAKIYENNSIFIVYIPREEMAYYHQGTQKPLFNAGVPIPFNVQQLTQLIEGKYSSVFGSEHSGKVSYARDDNSDMPASTFMLNQGPLIGNLTLNANGLPIFWQEMDNQGWSLSLGYRDNENTPYKLTMIHKGEGERAIFLIKGREYSLKPFTDAQMQLILPDDTTMQPLVKVQNLE